MGRFVKGDVVVALFPFSNLSQEVRDGDAIPLVATDFTSGGLNKRSNIRPNRLFTADGRIVVYRAGTLKADKIVQVIDKIVEIVRR